MKKLYAALLITLLLPVCIFAANTPLYWQCPSPSNITNNQGTWSVNFGGLGGSEIVTPNQPNSKPSKLISGSLMPMPDPYITYICNYETQNHQLGKIVVDSGQIKFAPKGSERGEEVSCIYGRKTPTFDPDQQICGSGGSDGGKVADSCFMTCQSH